MEFLLGKECNEIMVKQHQDSVNKLVKPSPGAKPLSEVKTIRPTYDEIDKGIPEVKELFRDTFGDLSAPRVGAVTASPESRRAAVAAPRQVRAPLARC